MDIVRLRYIGADRVRVPKLGRVVESDELVGVPAAVYARHGWPESQWRREDDQQAPPAPAAAATTTTTSRKGNKDA